MVFTDDGRQFVTYGLGSDIGMFINYVGIGSGSGAVSADNHTLIAEVNRVEITGSPDFTGVRTVTFQADFNSVQMSGIHLTEFGLFSAASGAGGSVWLREGFGSLVFDGTNELQITTALQVL